MAECSLGPSGEEKPASWLGGGGGRREGRKQGWAGLLDVPVEGVEE